MNNYIFTNVLFGRGASKKILLYVLTHLMIFKNSISLCLGGVKAGRVTLEKNKKSSQVKTDRYKQISVEEIRS